MKQIMLALMLVGCVQSVYAQGTAFDRLTPPLPTAGERRAADAKLTLLTRKIVSSQEEERAFVSRELHDSTSQTLVSVKLLTESALDRMPGDAGGARAPLQRALARLNEALVEVRDILVAHLEHLHGFYGEVSGVRIARKHLGWYAKDRPENASFRAVVNRAQGADEQLRLTREYFDALVAGASSELPAEAA